VERLQVKSDGILPMSPFYFTASCGEHAAVDSSRSQRLPIERTAAQIRSADSRARTTKLYNRRNDQLTLDQV
jgi:hypothetical protein